MERLVPVHQASDMTKTWDVVTISAALGCGVVGGVLFAFSTFVMSGLTRLPSTAGLTAMQSINVTAQQPPFMIAFFGTALGCVALAVHAVGSRGEAGSTLVLSGALLYLVGTVLLTVAYHVPLNDRLAKVDPGAADANDRWRHYATVWTLANHVRTVTAVAAMALLVIALVRNTSAHRAAEQGHDASAVTSSR